MSYAFDVAANNVSNANTISIAPAAGDVIVVFSETSSGGGSPTFTVADNVGGDSWVVPFSGQLQTTWYYSVAYLLNCPAGITTLTATFNGGTPGNTNMRAVAYSGVSGSYIGITSANFQTAPGSGANAITSNALNVTAQPSLLIGLCHDVAENGGFTAGSSPLAFTLRGTLLNGLAIEDTRVTATGNASATFTNSHASDNMVSWALAFSEGSGGGGGPQPLLMMNRRNVLYTI